MQQIWQLGQVGCVPSVLFYGTSLGRYLARLGPGGPGPGPGGLQIAQLVQSTDRRYTRTNFQVRYLGLPPHWGILGDTGVPGYFSSFSKEPGALPQNAGAEVAASTPGATSDIGYFRRSLSACHVDSKIRAIIQESRLSVFARVRFNNSTVLLKSDWPTAE